MEARGSVAIVLIASVALAACQAKTNNNDAYNGINGYAGAGFAGAGGAVAPPIAGVGGSVVGTAGTLASAGAPAFPPGIGGGGAGGASIKPVVAGSGGMPGFAGMLAAGMGGARAGAGGMAGGAGGGQGGAAGTMAGTATFAQITSILQMRCSSCHNFFRNPNLSSSNTNLYATLTSTMVSQCGGIPLVKPSDAMNSAILKLVQHQCGTFVMPADCTATPCIPMTEIQTISAWITAGAPMQ